MKRAVVSLRHSGGFSLVELIVVVGLLAVAGLVVAPTLAPSEHAKVDLAASQFADAVRFAREEALRTNYPHGVEIDSAARRIRVFRDTTGMSTIVPAFDVYHPVTKRLYDLDLDAHSATAGLTVQIGSVWTGTCNKPALLGFDAAGSPRCVDPWSVPLDQFGLGLIHDEGFGRVVQVDGVTGRVSIP